VLALVPLVVLALAVLALVVFDSDLAQHAGRGLHLTRRLLERLGPAASFLALYAEESGVPLPVAGDALVVYLGHRFAGSPLALVGAWLGLLAVVVAGSSNLYLISRRWGRPLVEGRLGPLFHLTPERIATVDRWFQRWGALAVIFGRHVFGFRVTVTVVAGILGLRYRVFALSVLISSAPWAAIWLWIGVRFGERIGRFISVHQWSYLVLAGGFVALFLAALFQTWREERRRSRARREATGGPDDPPEASSPRRGPRR
jgi:membrane protein DedA with SNARE-associated domain